MPLNHNLQQLSPITSCFAPARARLRLWEGSSTIRLANATIVRRLHGYLLGAAIVGRPISVSVAPHPFQ